MSAPCFSLSNKDLVVVQGPSLSNFSKYAVYLVKPATVIDRHAKYIPLGLYAAELKLKDPYRGLRREEGVKVKVKQGFFEAVSTWPQRAAAHGDGLVLLAELRARRVLRETS